MNITKLKLRNYLTFIFIFLIEVVYAQTKSEQLPFIPEQHKIISSDRPDGRYMSTRGFVQHMMRNIQPELGFNPQFSPDEFVEWQGKVRGKMQELMKFPVVPSQPNPKLISEVKRNNYTVEKWEIYPQPGSVVSFLMLVPNGITAKNPAPAVLNFCGSTRTKEATAGEEELNPLFKKEKHYEDNRMAMFYAEQGIISIVFDNPGIGENSDLEKYGLAPRYDRNTFSRYLLDMGWHYMGLWAFQGNQILNWMRTQDFIDSKRIALSGHSLGTEPLMALAVLNPDIRAIVFNDFLCRLRKRWIVTTKPDNKGRRPQTNWLGHCVPGMWKYFDYPDIIASLAPRPVILTEGGAQHDFDLLKRAYQIMDAPDNLSVHHQKKFEKAKNRKYDYVDIPEGLSTDEYWEYVNVDTKNHYFKANLAVPWLKNIFNK